MSINPYFDLFEKLQKTLSSEDLLDIRKKLIWSYSWAIPNPEAIDLIAAYSPLIELGAGTGYWAWLIANAGAQVGAYDENPLAVPKWVDLQKGTAQSVAVTAAKTLLLCWPPLNDPMASEALANFRGPHCIYIGEWRGRTADSLFHDLLDQGFKRVQEILIPNWPGFLDRVFVYERASRAP